jgi:hypothetical protein
MYHYPDLKENISARPIANPSSFFREDCSGWALLVNLDTAASVALNPTGSMIWKLIDGKRSFQEIVLTFLRSFPDAPPVACEDITALLNSLADEGLIGYEVQI